MTTLEQPARLWASTGYRRWLTADTASQFGGAITGFVMPLISLSVTGDPAQAGLISACGVLARICATLPGGSAADRHERPRLMAVGGLVQLALCVVLLGLILAGFMGLWTLLVLNVFLGLAGGYFAPASDAALKDVVPAALIGRAQSANQGRDAVVSLAAAPLGGVLLGFGMWIAAAGMAVTRVATIFAARALGAVSGRSDQARTRAPESDETSRMGRRTSAQPDEHPIATSTPAVGRGYGETLRWLWHRPDLRAGIIMAVLVNLGWSITTTTVIYALQMSGSDPAAIGVVSAAMGVGMLVGALLATPLVTRFATGRLTLAALLLTCLCAAALPGLNTPAGIVPVIAVAVLGVPALNAGILGYIMTVTPAHRMGKVSAVVNFGAMLAMPAAPVVAGFGLAGPGRFTTLAFGAALCLLSLLVAVGSTALRRIPNEARWAEYDAGR
ncbi:MAG: MFS transporter [Galactobacter sp.]